MPPPDLRLTLQEVIAGNAEAENKLCRFYRDQIFRYAYWLVRNYEDAEDVTQEALFAIVDNPERFLGDAKLSTYLCQIVNHKVADLWRKHYTKPIHVDIEGDDASLNVPDESRSSNPELAVGDALTEARFRKCLQKLPFEQQVVFAMFFVQGAKQTEIAKEVGCALGTVKSRIFAATSSLQRCLGPWYREIRNA